MVASNDNMPNGLLRDFKRELSDLLEKYEARLCFDCAEGSDLHGIFGDRLLVEVHYDGYRYEHDLTSNWCLGPEDLKEHGND